VSVTQVNTGLRDRIRVSRTRSVQEVGYHWLTAALCTRELQLNPRGVVLRSFALAYYFWLCKKLAIQLLRQVGRQPLRMRRSAKKRKHRTSASPGLLPGDRGLGEESAAQETRRTSDQASRHFKATLKGMLLDR
jgi:hypothetical protein